ncbi:MAG: UbiA family prenyltransferase, partial [Thermodesulfobacteriota bacterium]
GALAVFVVFSLLAFSLVLFLNAFTIALSFVAILLAIIYPFVKRVSSFPQVFLGAAFGWGAVMAWSAVRGEIGIPAILIFIANVFWSTAYDTIYALMDIEDDLKAGVKSTAIFFKSRVYEAVCLLYVATAAALSLVGVFVGLGAIYYFGVAVFCLFFIAMVVRLKKRPTREEADKVFRSNVWGGAFIFVSIVIDMNI